MLIGAGAEVSEIRRTQAQAYQLAETLVPNADAPTGVTRSAPRSGAKENDQVPCQTGQACSVCQAAPG